MSDDEKPGAPKPYRSTALATINGRNPNSFMVPNPDFRVVNVNADLRYVIPEGNLDDARRLKFTEVKGLTLDQQKQLDWVRADLGGDLSKLSPERLALLKEYITHPANQEFPPEKCRALGIPERSKGIGATQATFEQGLRSDLADPKGKRHAISSGGTMDEVSAKGGPVAYGDHSLPRTAILVGDGPVTVTGKDGSRKTFKNGVVIIRDGVTGTLHAYDPQDVNVLYRRSDGAAIVTTKGKRNIPMIDVNPDGSPGKYRAATQRADGLLTGEKPRHVMGPRLAAGANFVFSVAALAGSHDYLVKQMQEGSPDVQAAAAITDASLWVGVGTSFGYAGERWANAFSHEQGGFTVANSRLYAYGTTALTLGVSTIGFAYLAYAANDGSGVVFHAVGAATGLVAGVACGGIATWARMPQAAEWAALGCGGAGMYFGGQVSRGLWGGTVQKFTNMAPLEARKEMWKVANASIIPTLKTGHSVKGEALSTLLLMVKTFHNDLVNQNAVWGAIEERWRDTPNRERNPDYQREVAVQREAIKAVAAAVVAVNQLYATQFSLSTLEQATDYNTKLLAIKEAWRKTGAQILPDQTKIIDDANKFFRVFGSMISGYANATSEAQKKFAPMLTAIGSARDTIESLNYRLNEMKSHRLGQATPSPDAGPDAARQAALQARPTTTSVALDTRGAETTPTASDPSSEFQLSALIPGVTAQRGTQALGAA